MIPFSPSRSGNTTFLQRQQILEHFGVSSVIREVKLDKNDNVSMDTINDLADWVSEGKGVIISVEGGSFYDDLRYNGMGHAVTVTSVKKDKNGRVCGFYIADSNTGTSYYPEGRIRDAMRNVGINVTSQIIR